MGLQIWKGQASSPVWPSSLQAEVPSADAPLLGWGAPLEGYCDASPLGPLSRMTEKAQDRCEHSTEHNTLEKALWFLSHELEACWPKETGMKESPRDMLP